MLKELRSLTGGTGSARCMWLGAAIIASFAWYFSAVYDQVLPFLAYAAILIASMVLAYCTRAHHRTTSGVMAMIMPAMGTIAAMLLDGREEIMIGGLIILVPAGLVVGLHTTRLGSGKTVQCLSHGIVLATSMTSFLLLFHYAYERVLLYAFDLRLFDMALSPLLNWIGIANSLLDDGMYLLDGRSYHPLHFGLERLHLNWAIQYVVCCAIAWWTLCSRRMSRRLLAASIMQGCIVTLAWIVVSVLVYNYTKAVGFFICVPAFITVELLTVTLMLALTGPSTHTSREPELPLHTKFTLCRTFGVVALACFIVYFGWFPSGPRKKEDAILIDDYHSTWEWSDSPFDFSEEGFTKKSAYSYTNFADFLRYYYPIDINKNTPLNEIDLDRYSVIILKTATQGFTDDEKTAIREFVRNGGGLFVHGDHTNLYGMSTFFNEVLSPLPIQFHLDDQADFYGQPSEWTGGPWLNHPTVQGVRRFPFLTSCTLGASGLRVEPALVSKAIFSENAIYGKPGFFGNMLLDGNDRIGVFLQAAVVPYGAGRVAVFADSTVFSNFAVFQADYMDYALRTVEYLQHKSTPVRTGVLIIAFTAALFFGATALARRGRITWSLIVVHDINVAMALGVLLLALPLNCTGGFHTPPPRIPVPRVAVVLGNAQNTDVLSQSNQDPITETREFGSFLLAMQRAGQFPYACESVPEALETGFPMVLVNPVERPAEKTLKRLHEAVIHDGRSLLVLDSSSNAESSAGHILGSLGFDVRPRFIQETLGRQVALPDLESINEGFVSTLVSLVHYAEHGHTVAGTAGSDDAGVLSTHSEWEVYGGESLWVNERGLHIRNRWRYPSGAQVLVSLDAESFSNAALGAGFMRAMSDQEKLRLRQAQVLLRDFFGSDVTHDEKTHLPRQANASAQRAVGER